MADIRATQSGDFSATATWVGGVVPGSGDVAFSNTFTVTISDTRTVQAISNAAGTSITVGGTFSLLSGCNLTCTNANGVVQGATATSVITTAGMGAAQTAIINGNFPGGGSGASITHGTASTLRIVGNMTQPAGNGQLLLSQTGNGFFEITGNITLSGTGRGILLNSPGAPSFAATGTIVSNLTGGLDAINHNSTGTFTVTANITNNSSTCPLIVNNTTGSMTLNGTLQATGSQPVVGPGSTTPNIAQTLRLSGPFLMSSSGVHAVFHPFWRWIQNRAPSYMEVANWNNSAKDNLRTGDNMPTGGYPTVGNVLSTAPAYGDTSQFQGTYVSPAASTVASGVTYGPASTLTGTAILTAANVRAAVGMASANLDTQLAGISAPSAATVAAAVRTELTTELGRIDAAVSSRLAPSGTLATVTTLTNAPSVPSAAAIASQVRTELATELARLDVATSTRLAAASYSAAPTTTAIRTELAVELARLDVAVSTRLAPAGTLATVTTLTNAPSVPSAATIASQVRTELTSELARIANCSTVDTTATAIQDAVGA